MYNEKSLKNQLTEVINNELNSLGRVSRSSIILLKLIQWYGLTWKNLHITVI